MPLHLTAFQMLVTIIATKSTLHQFQLPHMDILEKYTFLLRRSAIDSEYKVPVLDLQVVDISFQHKLFIERQVRMLTVDPAVSNNETLPQRYRQHRDGEQPLHIQCAVNDCLCNITCSRPRQVRVRQFLYLAVFVVVLFRSLIASQKVANEAWYSGQRRDKDVESTVINLLTQSGLLNNVSSLLPLSISPISTPPTSSPKSLPPPLFLPTILPLSLSTSSFLNYTERLPIWFSEYVQFHNEAIQEISINFSSYVNYNYFILRCVPWDSDGKATCFGASDRLKMIPVMLKLAYQYNRIFFIYWEHPFPIEEFLLPTDTTLGLLL